MIPLVDLKAVSKVEGESAVSISYMMIAGLSGVIMEMKSITNTEPGTTEATFTDEAGICWEEGNNAI